MPTISTDNIRNFCVIAHIDHGKSTLCDRFLEITGTIEKRNMQAQLLDSNPIERERGITIKLAPVRMEWKGYILNLIDTPGHIDFSYEVSRSLAACEGAILVVDATQGVQAQTISNTFAAIKQGLKIIPVINKIDLQNADMESTKKELAEIFGFQEEEIILISAKNGKNCERLLQEVIERVPAPSVSRVETPREIGNLSHGASLQDNKNSLRALIFNSVYDSFKGVVIAVKIVDGQFNLKEFNEKNTLKFLATHRTCMPIESGYFKPTMKSQGILMMGEVGYIATGLKDLHLAQIGDTVTTSWEATPLPDYIQPRPMVFAGLFPVDSNQFLELKKSLEKLQLTDSALYIKPVTSMALGNGFHAGFLGLLHCEIIRERLFKEFSLEVLVTNPTVEYKIVSTHGEEKIIDNPTDFPENEKIREIYEPVVTAEVFAPKEYVGGLITLCEDKRGQMMNLEYFEKTAKLTYKMPYSEIITDFYDRLKSISSGYASLSYEPHGFEKAEIVKIDILLNEVAVDALSFMVEKSRAIYASREITRKLKDVIPRQQFRIAIQAAIGGKIICREDVNPFRKDVLKKMSGGDRSRKDKLLEAQKKGKKKMKNIGSVAIPQNAFFDIFRR
jgi:GTP-binding protein LepA